MSREPSYIKKSLCGISATAMASIFMLSCDQGEGIGPGQLTPGFLSIVPVFEINETSSLPVERMRITLTREESAVVALDTIIDLQPGQDSIEISLTVQLNSVSESFLLELKLIDGAQDTIFRAGPLIVTASASPGQAPAVQVPLSYVGTGFDAAAILITTMNAQALAGQTITLDAAALDSVGDPIANTPMRWSSFDATLGTFPDDEVGLFLAGSARGSTLVEARLLTGQTDTSSVMIQPLPTTLTVIGDNQVAPINSPLALPVGVRVTATDGLGVEGLLVVFAAAPGNGSLSLDSVLTDTLGVAQVTWIMGLTPGPMQATATVPAVNNTAVTINATAQLPTLRWINSAGGNWSNPANWDLGVVPGPGAIVAIDLDGTYTVDLDPNAVVTIAGLVLGGASGIQTLAHSISTLVLTGSSNVGPNGVFAMSGGALQGTAPLSVTGAFDWTGGSIDAAGILRIEPTGTFTLGGGIKSLNALGAIENFGAATWVAGDIQASPGASIINQSGATFDIQGDGLFLNQLAGTPAVFSNAGTVTRSTGTGLVTFNVQFDNLGTSNVLSGTLALAGGGASGGAFSAANASTLRFGGGSHSVGTITLATGGTLDVAAGTVLLNISSTLSGAVTVAAGGTLRFTGGTHAFDATSDVSGAGIVDFAGGAASVAGLYNVTGTSTHITGGTVNFNNVATPALTTALTMSAGTLGGPGNLQVSTTLSWTGGTWTGTGSVVVDPPATATLAGGTKTLDRRGFFNSGTVTWTGGDILSGNGAAIVNLTPATFDIQGDVALQFTLGGTMPSFTNAGTLRRSVGAGIASLASSLNNTGTIDAQTGALSVSGTFTHDPAATLQGAGEFGVAGDFVTGGTVSMATGRLSVGGVLNPTGTFTVGTVIFTGTGPQIIPSALSPYNSVEVTGTTDVDGSLTIAGTLVVSGTGVFNVPPDQGFAQRIVTVTGNVSGLDNSMISTAGTSSLIVANSNFTLSNSAMLYIGFSGGVRVANDFTTQNLATVRMTSSGDQITVGGNTTFGGGSTAGMLTGGNLQLSGNFIQSGDPRSFAPSGTFTTSIQNACVARTINFANPATSHFADVSMFAAQLVLETDVTVQGNLIGSGGVTETGGPHILSVTGSFTPSAGTCTNVFTFATLEVGDVLSVPIGVSLTNTTTVFLGLALVPPQVVTDRPYVNVEVRGPAQLDNQFGTQSTITGNLVVSSNGVLDMNITDITVNGDFRTQDNGVLTATFDTNYEILTVLGNMEFGGGPTGGLLTEADISVAGNFTQTSTSSPESFQASGFTTVTFIGTGPQTITFATPGIGVGVPLSHFNAISFSSRAAPITLGSDVFARGTLSVFGQVNQTIVGNGSRLAVGGLNFSNTTFDHVLLEWNGTPGFPSVGSFVRVSNVSFINYNPTEIQFDIIHPGGGQGAFSITGLTFGTAPTRGVGAYVRATDSDGPLAVALTLNLTVTSPVTCSGADFEARSGAIMMPSCGQQFTLVAAGRAHSCGINVVGNAYCWGDNADGQLGDGTNTPSNVPVAVAGSLVFQDIGAGADHSCGVTTTGAAYCWGRNTSGQLGNNTTVASSVPVLVSGAGTFLTVAGGSDHTCGVLNTGAANCWGNNVTGQLGDATNITRLTPVPVTGGLLFTVVELGSTHTCGATQTNTVYCWGDNTSGQLGDATNTASNIPALVSGGFTFRDVAVGSDASCATTTGGVGYCWGNNSNGQFGNGTTTNSNIPVSVSGGITWEGIAVGSSFSCGSDVSGTVYCWGDNTFGQLGDGTNTSSFVPVTVSGGISVAEGGLGTSHGCVTTGTGAVYCWGRNLNGQLGNAANTDSNVPVLVTGT